MGRTAQNQPPVLAAVMIRTCMGVGWIYYELPVESFTVLRTRAARGGGVVARSPGRAAAVSPRGERETKYRRESRRGRDNSGRSSGETMTRHTIAIIGVGTVGQSWAALFLSYGNSVRLWDPAQGLAERFAAYLESVVTEQSLPPQPKLRDLWVVCDTVEEALRGATYVQENAPENMETKQTVLRQIDEALATDVVVGSSTSSFLLKDMVAKCTRAPSRIVLSHPFNREQRD